MRQTGVRNAFAFDRHFLDYGYDLKPLLDPLAQVGSRPQFHKAANQSLLLANSKNDLIPNMIA